VIKSSSFGWQTPLLRAAALMGVSMNFSKLLPASTMLIATVSMCGGIALSSISSPALAVEMPAPADLKEQSDKALANLTIYKSPQFGFSIKYPQNWEKSEGQPPLICRFRTDNGLVSYRVSAEKLPAPMTVEEYAKVVSQELEKQYPPKDSPLTRVEESLTKIGTIDAHKSTYILKLDASGTSAKMLQYLIVANQSAYAFNYTAIENAYDAFMPLITEVVSSLEFQPATDDGASATTTVETKTTETK
jgi:hypothetical protein